MFDSGKNVLIFAILLALLIFGAILEGYFLVEQVTLTPNNWKGIIILRLGLHLLGTLPLWILIGGLTESIWKPTLIGGITIALMNINPLRDLWDGPLVIEHIQPEEWYREEYNNPSSDVDFSTHKVPMIRLEQNGRAIFLTEERWQSILATCNNQLPLRLTGLQHLEVQLECTCLSNAEK